MSENRLLDCDIPAKNRPLDRVKKGRGKQPVSLCGQVDAIRADRIGRSAGIVQHFGKVEKRDFLLECQLPECRIVAIDLTVWSLGVKGRCTMAVHHALHIHMLNG
jgi:hypothetical protein